MSIFYRWDTYSENSMYQMKIDILTRHGYTVLNIDGLDYVEDDPGNEHTILVCIDDIPCIYEFLGE